MGSIFVTYKPKLLDGVYQVRLYEEFNSPKFSRALYNGTELTESDLSSFNYLTVPDENDVVIEYQFDDGIIPDKAFQYSSCIKLEFGSGIISVGWNAFASCGSLLEIILPDYEVNWELPNSDELYGYTFAGCSSLINVVFPENVYDYSDAMFEFCSNLVSIDGTKIKEIKPYMFSNCTSLNTFVVSDTSEGIGVNAFNNCTSLSSISIGSGVTHIDGFAFSDCTSLEEITLPSKINVIMAYAFGDCTSLKTIHAENTTQIWLPYLPVFTNVVTGGTLYYPAGADYSTWLSNQEGTLGYYGWNGVEIEPEPEPIPDGEIVTPNKTIVIVTSGKTFQYTIETNNIQNILSYYISFNGNKYLDTIDGFISMEMVDMNNFNITVEENEGDERRCGIYFIYRDYNGNQLTHVLSIVQDAKPDEPDEPDEPTYIEPEIRLYKTRLDYASDGGDKYVQIDYYGATSILEPTCTQSWVTIQKTQSGGYEEDGVRVYQHQYRITMEPTNFARNINVVFSCTDVNGVVFKDNHLMLYQSAPVATPTIVVSKNNISLDNVGDTSVIQVTYINVDEIIPPTVPDGFTIEEIERVESEDGIQVKYKITRISPKRQNAQINFNGNNTNSGESATSGNVTIKGEPVPAEVEVTMIWPKKGDYFLIEEQQDCHIDFRVTNFNTPYKMSYTINDSNNAIYLRKSNESTVDNELYLSYDFKSLPNNTNNPFTGSIDFTYKDELTDYSVSIPFYVKYKNQGEVTVYTDLINFDKDGNRLGMYPNDMYVNVNYIRINELQNPEIDGDWIHVGSPTFVGDYKGWVEGEYVVVGETYRYDISIDTNGGASRSGSITFKGTGIDGREATFELEINQEGSDVVKPVDEGYIELQQLSVELMADGGAQTFQVKYYDAKTIYEPELEFDWATITEVERTEPVPDTAWNGEECESLIITYRVTAESTESGRQMKVKFISDINYYDGGVVHMEKDKFIIYQLAEGSTEVQGSVSILKYSKSFTYYGTPTGWDFRVGYKNVTPDTPAISESWCRIGEVIDKTSDEYDYYKEYILEMDTNNSTLSRTCTITFIGNAEDGTQIKTPFQFTQQGQEEIINEGEYDNYKGYFMDFEGALHSVSFITNPRSDIYGDIRLAGDSPVVVSYSENGKLYEPIRTSNCTVKVVSSHYLMNLYSGKAQGTQVILRNEDRDTIEWCGFLQPNLYNQGFSECIEEIEFEASDCLSTLQYLRYEYFYNGNGQPMIVSFKDIVDTIADRCNLINSYVFTQKLFSNSDESKIFDFKEFYISENNFYSEEGEPWTYKEVLEETCKYFGYVCFQWGDRIYFMDFDKYQSSKSMVGYSYSKSDNWYNRSYITLSNPNRITEKSIRGTGADISLDDVFNKVTVNCNYYNVEHIIPDLFEDDNLTERDGITITTVVNRGQEIGSKTSFITYDHKNIISHFYKPEVGISIHEREVTPTEDEFKSKTFFKSFIGANIVDMYQLDYGDVSGRSYETKEWERYLMISQLNRPWCGYEGTWHWENYNFPIMEFTQLPQIFIDNNEEVYASTSTGSTGGRVPSTRVGGIGSSSTTSRNDRNNNVINVNKSEHYLVIKAEAAFSPNFDVPFIDENADPRGFEKKSNNYYEGFYFDKIRANYDASNKDEQEQVIPALTFYLEIPQAGWWNGTKWVDYETWFEVPLEPLNYLNDLWYTSKNVENKVNTNLFLGETGYKIQLPEKMESTAFMQFKIGMPKRFAHVADSWGGDNSATAGNAYCFIKDLEMNIVSRNSALMKDEDIVYENVIDDNNVVDGPEIDLKITSDNNITYSFSTVSTKYGEDMVNTTNFRFYDLEGELILPEEGIVERYVKQYSTPTLKENVTVDMSFTPTQMITDTYWDKDFVIVGQELDYARCSQKVTLLEKK